jgi:ubiquinone/menaquinone biosynthesis C-methylase UbiE
VEVDPRWYETFFERDWLELVALRISDDRTQSQVDFLVEALGVEPGARILDLACGHGRHSLELARRGYRVTGLDLSAPSLEVARQRAGADGLTVEFGECDMRDIPFEDEFDAVVNLFTAFGYFENEAEDERVLAAVARALHTGGVFLLDTIHPPWVYRHFDAREWDEHDDGTIFLQDRSLDLLRGRSEAVWVAVRPDGTRSELRHSVRLYTLADLASMLTRAGLAVERTYGGFDGSELGIDSNRLIVLARKG